MGVVLPPFCRGPAASAQSVSDRHRRLLRSGKSTLARALAPSVGAVPGALVLRSDGIRKRLFGVPLLEPLGPEGYTHEASDRVYATLAERASVAVRGGCSAIVDAVYASTRERQIIERVAAS